MKNYHKIAIAALLVLVIACTEKFDMTLIPSTVVPSIKEYYLTVGQKEFSFPSTEFNANTTVSSSGVWNFVGQASWLNISPAQGSGGTSAVSLTAAANSITESRISIFELQSPQNDEGWYASHTITASQKATEAYIKVNNTTNETYTGAVTFDGKSNSKDFFVDSNCEWEVSFSDNWMDVSSPVTVSDIRERITLSVYENTTNQQREGTVTLSYSYDGETVATEIRVYQKPASITASADVLSYTYVGGTGVISFNSEASWTAYTNDSFIELVADNSTTFDVDKGSSITGNAGSGTFGINVAKNSSQYGRNGAVYITVNGKDIIELPIEQGNVTLTVSESYHNLSYQSSMTESKNIYVASNAAYNLSANCDWISFNDQKDGNVEIIAADNPSIQSRKATVYVTSSEDATLQQEISVTQSEKTFELYSPDNANLNFGWVGKTNDIIIYTNAKWTASTTSDWITIESTSSTPSNLGYVTIPVKASDNSSVNKRSGKVEIKMEGNSTPIVVDVYQDPVDGYISNTDVRLGNLADTVEISFLSNAPWSATTSEDWITVTPANGDPGISIIMAECKIEIAVKENTTPNERQGSVYINIYDKQLEIKVTQSSPNIDISYVYTSLRFGNTPDTTEIRFRTNAPWNAKADSDWIKVTPESGAPNLYDDTRVQISVSANSSANERKGKVTISMYETSQDIVITQDGAYMSIPSDSLSFSHYASNTTLDLNTNGVWSAASNSDWIMLEPDGNKLKISVTDNNSTEGRDGKVTITMYDGTYIVKIHQGASTIVLDREMLSFGHSAGQKEFHINSSTAWTIEVDPPQSWLSVDPQSGGSESSYTNGNWITVKASHNDENKERTGKIIVTTKSEVKTLTVKQDQKYLEIESPALDFTASGGKSTISITQATDEYKAYSDQDWVTVTKDDWYNRVSVQVLFNNSRYERTATVTIENDYNKSYKLTLTQQGRTISVSEAGAELFAKGGSAVTAVTVDGDFTVSTPSGSWLTATHQEGTNKITITAAENETGKERTEYVTVSLANQPEGEEVLSEKFAVKQYPYTNKINLEGFEGADKDVTVVKGKGFSINITTYTSDKDYNKQNGGVNTTVNGYGDDKGKDKNSNGNITINGYGDDKNYNN